MKKTYLLCALLALSANATVHADQAVKVALTKTICTTLIQSGQEEYNMRLDKAKARLRKHVDKLRAIRDAITPDMRLTIERFNSGELPQSAVTTALAPLDDLIQQGNFYLWFSGNKVSLLSWGGSQYHLHLELQSDANKEYKEFFDRVQDRLAVMVSNDACYQGPDYFSECLTQRPERIFRNEREFLEGNRNVPSACFPAKGSPELAKLDGTAPVKLVKVPPHLTPAAPRAAQPVAPFSEVK